MKKIIALIVALLCLSGPAAAEAHHHRSGHHRCHEHHCKQHHRRRPAHRADYEEEVTEVSSTEQEVTTTTYEEPEGEFETLGEL